MRSTTAWSAAVLAMVLGSAAHAELYQCRGPDGKTIYTDQKDTCPGADPFEPSGVVHKAVTPEPPSAGPASRVGDPLEQEAQANAAAQWKQRKAEAEQRLQSLQARREYIERYVGFCNR